MSHLERVTWLLAALMCLSTMRAGAEGYPEDLARIEAGIQAVESSPEGQRSLRLAYLRLKRGGLSHDPRDYIGTLQHLDGVGGEREPMWYLLRTSALLKLHRLKEAAQTLERLEPFAETPEVRLLSADLRTQSGDYPEAAAILEALVEQDPRWGYKARLAHLHRLRGDIDGARAIYAEAAAGLDARDMQAYAWLQLQLGYLALTQGQKTRAAEHYRTAERAYPGYWLTADYSAEWLAVNDQADAALARYLELAGRPEARPEIRQALGDFYRYLGRPEEARGWLKKAEAAYLASARRNEGHYYHHLAALYSDSLENAGEAVRWARADRAQRDNPRTRAALAWAYYREGRTQQALALVRQNRDAGWRDAHALHQAGLIHLGAGELAEGQRLFREATALEPDYGQVFHVHR